MGRLVVEGSSEVFFVCAEDVGGLLSGLWNEYINGIMRLIHAFPYKYTDQLISSTTPLNHSRRSTPHPH